MDLQSIAKSLLRTLTPMVAGLVITLALHFGWKVDDATALIVAQLLIAYGYFTLARLLEAVHPGWGRALLALGLFSSVPVYVKPEAAKAIAEMPDASR